MVSRFVKLFRQVRQTDGQAKKKNEEPSLFALFAPPFQFHRSSGSEWATMCNKMRETRDVERDVRYLVAE